MPRVCSKVIALGSIAVLGLGISCQRQQAAPIDNRSGDEAVVRLTSLACTGAVVAGEVERVLTFYADGALVLPPNGPSAEGKEQIGKFWSQFVGDQGYMLRWKSIRIGAAKSGELAYEMGTYEMALKDAKEKLASQGRFLAVWKKQYNDEWKMVAQMFYADGRPSTGQTQMQTAAPGGALNKPVGEATTARTTAQSRFAVQVRAAESPDEAERWAELLSARVQQKALVVQVETHGKTFYRVRIPVESAAEAQNLAARVRHEFKLETWIVPLP